MVKTFMTIAGLVLCVAGASAQDMLQVQGTSPNLYVTHMVKKGETFYSLGRAYSLSPKDIATENSISFEQGLQLGQQVKIPLTNNNFTQQGEAGAGTPVYHKVEEKETLYRLSVNHNKVPLDNIRHWNNLSGDGLKKDSYVIVGFLKGGGGAPVASTPAPSTPPPASTTPPPAATPAPAPVTPAPAPKPEPAAPVATTPSPAATTPEPVKAPEPKPAASTSSSSGASFESLYNQQTNNGKNTSTEKGPGGWFKSNAAPGKYYALHNTAQRGTIIKVTNPLNGKSIYAKVLESIPQIKQNAGLIIKLSDSALEALGTNDAKFYVELNYED